MTVLTAVSGDAPLANQVKCSRDIIKRLAMRWNPGGRQLLDHIIGQIVFGSQDVIELVLRSNVWSIRASDS